jgi:hypothetical protein
MVLMHNAQPSFSLKSKVFMPIYIRKINESRKGFSKTPYGRSVVNDSLRETSQILPN